MKRLTALDLRKRLGSILNEVHDRMERFIVSRANKPLALIISVERETTLFKQTRQESMYLKMKVTSESHRLARPREALVRFEVRP
jgi:prevent-host-death family protein